MEHGMTCHSYKFDSSRRFGCEELSTGHMPPADCRRPSRHHCRHLDPDCCRWPPDRFPTATFRGQFQPIRDRITVASPPSWLPLPALPAGTLPSADWLPIATVTAGARRLLGRMLADRCYHSRPSRQLRRVTDYRSRPPAGLGAPPIARTYSRSPPSPSSLFSGLFWPPPAAVWFAYTIVEFVASDATVSELATDCRIAVPDWSLITSLVLGVAEPKFGPAWTGPWLDPLVDRIIWSTWIGSTRSIFYCFAWFWLIFSGSRYNSLYLRILSLYHLIAYFLNIFLIYCIFWNGLLRITYILFFIYQLFITINNLYIVSFCKIQFMNNWGYPKLFWAVYYLLDSCFASFRFWMDDCFLTWSSLTN